VKKFQAKTGVMSGTLSFILSYERLLNILTNRTTVGVKYSVDLMLKGSSIADWFVENMNPDMTPNRLLLDVTKKKRQQTSNFN